MSELLTQTPVKTETFKDQHSDVHEVESEGGIVKYVDISSEHLSDKVPILLAGGWSVGRRGYRSVAEKIYDEDRRVLLIDHARSGQAESGDKKHAKEALQKAHSLLAVMDDAGIEKADVIAHSEGAVNAVLAALEKPDRFRSIILVAPAGMIGKDTVSELLKRFAPKQARSLTKDFVENPRAASAVNIFGGAYIAANPKKSLRELQALTELQIDRILQILREKGIKIGLIQSKQDPVFPHQRIAEHISIEGIRKVKMGESIQYQWDPNQVMGNVDVYASVANRKAGHDHLIIHPDESMNVALNMLNSLNH